MSDSADFLPELETFSIVIIGAFNPSIFHPLWFSNNNLIREEEGRESEVEIIHKSTASFRAPWFHFQCTLNRMQIQTADPTKSRPIRDLAVGVFQILEHTPIEKLGLNHAQHIKMDTEKQWHDFGHHFAPKASWNGLLREPGLRELTMEGTRQDCDADRIWLKIGCSTDVENGVFIDVNQHYDLDKANPGSDGSPKKELRERYLAIIGNCWDDFLDYTSKVARQLILASRQEGA